MGKLVESTRDFVFVLSIRIYVCIWIGCVFVLEFLK